MSNKSPTWIIYQTLNRHNPILNVPTLLCSSIFTCRTIITDDGDSDFINFQQPGMILFDPFNALFLISSCQNALEVDLKVC